MFTDKANPSIVCGVKRKDRVFSIEFNQYGSLEEVLEGAL